MGFLQSINSWIFLPEYVELAISENGGEFETIAQLKPQVSPRFPEVVIENMSYESMPFKSQYLMVLAKNIGVFPDWHHGAGGKAWLFCDEIIIQ
jgi:hexosaminidase